MALPGAAGRGGPGAPAPFGRPDDLLHKQAGTRWPLIPRLLEDDVYAARYRELLQHATGGLFAEDAALRRLRQLHAMIAPAVVGERGERPTHTTVSSPDVFNAAIDGVNGLKAVIAKRHDMVRTVVKLRRFESSRSFGGSDYRSITNGCVNTLMVLSSSAIRTRAT